MNLHKICNQTWRRSVEMRRVYRRDAELFNGTAAAGLLQEGKTRDQHKLQTLRRRMRGIVEDVLWEGGVLTTDEIYRGVKTKHAQLGQLLPPRWQEEVKRILEAHCISHEGNSWFLENIEQLIRQTLEAHRISHEGNSRFLEKLEPLEERPECETSLFDPHGTSERIINDSNRGQKRTDWANTESYRYLDLALPKYVAGDMVRNVLLGTFLSGLRQLRRLANWVYPRGHGPVWRLWQLRCPWKTHRRTPNTEGPTFG